MVSFGDGWHNNHHAYPVSARHGLKWYEIDCNWYTIWIFKQLGLTSRIHDGRPPARGHAIQRNSDAPDRVATVPSISNISHAPSDATPPHPGAPELL